MTTPPKITIIDYDAGNLRNVQKAVEFLGFPTEITDLASVVEDARALVLPGVGAFNDGMSALQKRGLDQAIHRAVLEKGAKLLGICLGMQLLAKSGEEGQYTLGLDLLPMIVKKMEAESKGLRLPHIGWNNIKASAASVLFSGIPTEPDFYFVHSYRVIPENEGIVAATAEYGGIFVAAVEQKNIFGTQFHPEKSQRYGLQVLKNFLNYA